MARDKASEDEKQAARKAPDNNGAEYKIGFGKPPLQHRFRPGKSGNPAGRKPGEKSFQKLLALELDGRVPVKVQGQNILLSRRAILVKRAVAEAMAGNHRVLAMVVANDPMAAVVVADEIASALSRPFDETVKQDFLRRLSQAAGGVMAGAQAANVSDEAAVPDTRPSVNEEGMQ